MTVLVITSLIAFAVGVAFTVLCVWIWQSYSTNDTVLDEPVSKAPESTVDRLVKQLSAARGLGQNIKVIIMEPREYIQILSELKSHERFLDPNQSPITGFRFHGIAVEFPAFDWRTHGLSHRQVLWFK